MKPERLFLHVMTELRQLRAAGDEYSAIKASRLLRQLLLDGYPLADKANTLTRVKLRFTVGVSLDRERIRRDPQFQRLVFYSVMDLLRRQPEDGALHLPAAQILNRDGLLASVVIYVEGHFITVKQMIEHVAHVLGGVHAGDAKEDFDKALNGIHDSIFGGNLPIVLKQLFTLCEVVIDGLAPLEDAIRARWGRDGP